MHACISCCKNHKLYELFTSVRLRRHVLDLLYNVMFINDSISIMSVGKV